MKKYPEEIYSTRDGGLLTGKQRKNAGAGWGRRHAYEVGYEAGKAEQSNYIESISSLDSVLTDVEQLEGEDLPFVKRLIERTVRAVRAEQADPLAGYSNLTEAISAGEPIDYEKLDGLKVQCVRRGVGELRGVLKRDNSSPIYTPDGWWKEDMDYLYAMALVYAWWGSDGWTLYIEGEIPLRRKTADQLKLGTYFREVEGGALMYVGAGHQRGLKAVYRSPEMFVSPVPAEKWEVIEECGPFQKPEGK